jgi:hypothetical protein
MRLDGREPAGGGANGEDVARYFALTDDLKLKPGTRDRIDSGMYRYLSSFTFYRTSHASLCGKHP